MEKPQARGASISAHARVPSVDLSRLAKLLVDAIPPEGDGPKQVPRWPLVSFDSETGRLLVNTRGVLQRLYDQPNFRRDLAPTDSSGFLRDLTPPPFGSTARMGGRLTAGTEKATTEGIDRLSKAIGEAIDACLPDATRLVTADGAQLVATLAGRLKVEWPPQTTTATLVPIHFAARSQQQAAPRDEVARLFSAVEEIAANDWLELMLDNLQRALARRDGLDTEDIDAIVESLRAQRTRPDSQIARFLDFLEDAAMARVRLSVTFALMNAVGEQAPHCDRRNGPLLGEYVRRVNGMFRLFGDVKGRSLPIELSRAFGMSADFDLAEELRKATFYLSLPVWADWATQIFEIRRESPESGGFSTRREVSYRFRVNGMNPVAGESAFAARLDRLKDAASERATGNMRWALADVIFLALVVPRPDDIGWSDDRLFEEAQTLAARLRAEGAGAIKALLDELSQRESNIDAIASALVATLRTRSTPVLSAAARNVATQYICVQLGLLNQARLGAAGPGSDDLLVRPSRGSEATEWFKHLVISDDPAQVVDLWTSIRVRTRLAERTLARVGESREIQVRRDVSGPVLPILWRPFLVDKGAPGSEKWLPQQSGEDARWMPSPGIEIQYDPRALTRRQDRLGKQDEQQLLATEQYHSAAGAAFTLITYLVQWHVLRRLRAAMPDSHPTALVLRLQDVGRGEPTDGSEVVYAAAQAVEAALSREVHTRMQGLVTGGDGRLETHRRRGTFSALTAAFPTFVGCQPAIDRVAIVTYGTRPSDVHQLFPDADGHLFLSRTYLAEAVTGQTPGYRIRQSDARTRLVDSRARFRDPQLILEEIAHLRELGVRHVLLLSHHFGNRHLARAAERHSPHSSPEFLQQVAERFPDMHVYPLRRDVFPATRLRLRKDDESGFEVLRRSEHGAMFERDSQDLLRGLLPIYTFATLAIAGGDEGRRPQSGFCTYFLDTDERISNVEWSEKIRHEILGSGDAESVRASLIAALRGLHYHESEKAPTRKQVLPVLDPFDWVLPDSAGAAGEVLVSSSRRKGRTLLSHAALLAHAANILHKRAAP